MKSKRSDFLAILICNKLAFHQSDNKFYLPNDAYNVSLGDYNCYLKYSSNTIVATDVSKDIIILLAGDIYQDDFKSEQSKAEYLVESYKKLGIDFVKNLNGSFCIFLANKSTNEIYLLTDRLNTRKIFYFKEKNTQIFSTELPQIPINDFELSYAGVASYLINGAIYNNLTIFDKVNILDRACKHRVNNCGIDSEKYWYYDFTNEYGTFNEIELAEELHRLYLKSIENRIKDKEEIFISLSGGHDSRGIAAIVKELTDNDIPVKCFSHNFGTMIDGTDAYVASRIADHLGFSFELLNSYNGNPVHVVKYNANLGHGIAYFCVEADAWQVINKQFNSSKNILLVGDMNDGTFTQFHGNKKRALERTGIYESQVLNAYKYVFSNHTFSKLCDSWDVEFTKILKSVSGLTNIVNTLDYLYIDQRIPHVNSVAREFFQMPFIQTSSPYYDNDILDFIRKLSPYHRDNKKLHRLTLERYYPDVFKISRPTRGWGSKPDWENEIALFKEGFQNDIRSNPSKLDFLIPSELLINALNNLDKNTNKKSPYKIFLKNLHLSMKKVFHDYHKIIEFLPGGKEFTRKGGGLIQQRSSNFFVKALILRYFLNEMSTTKSKPR